MARIDPDGTEEALKKKGCRLMDFTGKTMKGFLFIDPEGTDMDADLAALEQQRDKTRALKQGMMQELLTGRIRLV